MTSRFALLAGSLAAMSALSAGRAQPSPSAPLLPVVWSARLQLPSLDALPARLSRPFEHSVTVRKDQQTAAISNCAAYLAETRKGFRASNDQDLRRLQFVGADCRALDLLAAARPARRSALAGAVLDPRFLPPVLSFLPSAESRKRALADQSKGLSWKDSEPDIKVSSSGPDLTAVETATGLVRIEWCARGDFNGDGVEDLLVRVASSARQGTYARIRLFLLTRSTPREVLRVLHEFN